ncbi:uncharacterized protein LOC123005162 [Tribolium madens]|uniref:uncharacterized protein LOC123005162 n=1 Tax=Tribolium madens TaxID=41895 RepID=UPI001CF73487|nr:uncharacterized protein LOC123005162 [Tribolium madens]
MSVEQLRNIISPKFDHEVLSDIVVKKSNLKDIQIKEIKIDEGSARKGDSYLSQICRFTIDATGKNESHQEDKISLPVIAKFLPKNLARRKTYRSPVFFENEGIFYEKVWPAFQQFQDSKNLSKKFENIPLMLSQWIDGDNDFIILEDVSPQGYKSAVRGSDLDENHSVAILKLLANFHSLSIAFKDQKPEIFDKAATSLKETYFAEKYRNWFEPFLQKLYIVALDAVENEFPQLLPNLKKYISGDVFGKICEGCQLRGPYSVVTHGDVWAPNFLIKYAEKHQIKDIVMIDFQLSRYTTLAGDLIFFLLTCVDINLIEQKWNFLIEQYHVTLAENLVNLGSDPNLIKLEGLHKELKESMKFGLGVVIESLIMSLLDETEVGDLDGIEKQTPNFITLIMSIQELQKIISPKFTQQVIDDIIKKKSGLSDVSVKKIEIGASSKKGDSYLSNICRFTIDANGKNKKGNEESISIPVIVKYFPKNIARRNTYRSADFFENEIIFYEKVWNAFEKFQDEAKITNKFDNIPAFLSACCDGENDYVALLDLSFEGYTSAERGAGLDYPHTVAILQVLAKFHAVSLAFKDQQPQNFETAATSLKETYFSEKLRPWYSNFQKQVFVVIRDAVEKELPREYLQKLDNIINKDLYGLLVKSCEVKGPLSVVTHGDVWVPNFLIKYEGPKLGKIKMIDFQLTRYTTLATDLAFFLFACVDMTLIENKYDDFVKIYHQSLSESLEKFGSSHNLVTLDQIKKELLDHSILGVGMSMEALIMAQLDDDDVSDLDGIKGDQAVPLESVWLISPFKAKEKRQRIAKMIKFAVDRNLI